MKKIIPLIALLSSTIFAQEAPVPDLTNQDVIENEKDFNHHKSHWLVSFGGEQISYDVPFDYQGDRKKFEPGKQSLWGGRFGLGRQLYLGEGVVATTKLEAFYMGTLFESAINAAPEIETEEFSYTKKTGQIFGGDVTQSLGYLFNAKMKNPVMGEMTYLVIEPFIEAGVGIAWALNRQRYNYDTGPGGVREEYDLKVSDTIISNRLGVGVNATSNEGYFFYLKATLYSFIDVQRKLRGEGMVDDGPLIPLSKDPEGVDLDSTMIYALGGGYKF